MCTSALSVCACPERDAEASAEALDPPWIGACRCSLVQPQQHYIGRALALAHVMLRINRKFME